MARRDVSNSLRMKPVEAMSNTAQLVSMMTAVSLRLIERSLKAVIDPSLGLGGPGQSLPA